MVKMKFVCSTASYTSAAISLPDFELDPRRYNPATGSTTTDQIFCYVYILNIVYSNKFELEDIASAIGLNPGVYEMKKTVVRPYPWFYFLINPNNIGAFCASLILLGSPMKLSVLSKGT